MPDEEPAGVPQTTEVPGEPPDELSTEFLARLAAMVRTNAEEGSVDWQTVAEWALDEVMA